MHALVINGIIEAVGTLPQSARRLDNDEWVMGLTTAPTELVEACGWFPVVDTARPADTPTTTHDRSVELVNGAPTVTWTARDKTADELEVSTHADNRSAIDAAITQALTRLQQLIDAPAVDAVPAGTMTTAQLSTVARSMRDAVQQNRAGAQDVAGILRKTIRLVRGDFDGVD